jgi:hypothetical protein
MCKSEHLAGTEIFPLKVEFRKANKKLTLNISASPKNKTIESPKHILTMVKDKLFSFKACLVISILHRFTLGCKYFFLILFQSMVILSIRVFIQAGHAFRSILTMISHF